MLELRDFKRIFSFATLFLTIISIWKSNDTSSIDLTVLMFIVSNMLAVSGVELQEKWKKLKEIKVIRKALEYFIWLSLVVIIFDDSNHIFSTFLSLVLFKWLYTVIVVIVAIYCIVIVAFAVSQQDLEKSIKQATKVLSDNFEDAAKEFSKEIDDKGGWSEFIKTDVGRQFANSVKLNSHPKSPRDYRKHNHKKRNRHKN